MTAEELYDYLSSFGAENYEIYFDSYNALTNHVSISDCDIEINNEDYTVTISF